MNPYLLAQIARGAGPVIRPSIMSQAMGAAPLSDAEYDALRKRDQSGDLDQMLTADEAQALADERARRTPVAKEGDPGVVSMKFDDTGKVKRGKK